MKAKNYNGTIKVYSTVPKSHGNIIAGFDLLSDSELEGHGFYDVVIPTYDSRIKELGNIYFDTDNSQFTYPVSNKTWTESLADLKAAKIKQLKDIYNSKLAKTDWYVTRKSEKGTAIPSDIQTERDDLRTECSTHETAINAKTTKAQVESYDLPSII
jgi:hypothetical protein